MTALQQTQLIQLAVGMLDVAPGAVLLADLDSYIQDGGSTDLTSLAVAVFLTLGGGDVYPSDQAPEDFANTFLEGLLGDTVSAADRDLAAGVVVQILNDIATDDPDQDRVKAMSLVVTALASLSPTDATWGEAAQQFSNRVLVAHAYSVDAAGAQTDFAALHDVIAAVTESPLSVVMTLNAINTAIADSDTNYVGPPNVVAILTTYGGDSADTIVGGGGPDILVGGGGGDTLTGSMGVEEAGMDVVLGGAGDDVIIGAEKYDWIDGGTGNDTLKLDSSKVLDNVYFQPVDQLLQNVETIDISGDTTITVDLSKQTEKFIVKIAGASGHVVTGGSAADTISGGGGNDTLMSGGGKDVITGGGGDDIIIGAYPGSSIDGGVGKDTLQLEGSNVVANAYTQADDTKLAGIEVIEISGDYSLAVNLTGQTENLTFILSGEGQSLISGGGKDTILGARAIDTINGGAGIDTLFIDSTNTDDGTYAPLHNNSLSGVEIISVTDDSPVTIDLRNQTEGFTVKLIGDNGHIAWGGAGADSIIGSDGDDTLQGGSGKDTITAGLGEDRINLDETVPARDRIIYAATNEFGDTITGFKAGIATTSDQIQLPLSMFNALGNSSATAIVVSSVSSASKLFALNSTIIICPNLTIAGNATTTDLAELLVPYGSNAKYAAGDKLIFGVGDSDGNTRLYYFVSDGAQDSIIDTELTLTLTLVGVAAKDLAAINFVQ